MFGIHQEKTKPREENAYGEGEMKSGNRPKEIGSRYFKWYENGTVEQQITTNEEKRKETKIEYTYQNSGEEYTMINKH